MTLKNKNPSIPKYKIRDCMEESILTIKLSKKEAVTEISIDQDTVILDLLHQTYFGLNAVSANIWSFLEGEERNIIEIARHIQQTYMLSEEKSLNDALCFVEHMIKNGLLHVHNHPPTSAVTKSI
jgi:tRNA G37 N-methylase Trm5